MELLGTSLRRYNATDLQHLIGRGVTREPETCTDRIVATSLSMGAMLFGYATKARQSVIAMF
jgi:hypothetical protein